MAGTFKYAHSASVLGHVSLSPFYFFISYSLRLLPFRVCTYFRVVEVVVEFAEIVVVEATAALAAVVVLLLVVALTPSLIVK
ncbi:hypothetical protein ElyMa_005440200, partial [Elysia marginata]